MPWLLLCLLGLFAAGLVLTLYLFFDVKRQAAAEARKLREALDALHAEFERLRTGYEALRGEFADLEERTGMLSAPPPTPSGLNMNKRSQALRMLRRGDPPEQVAAALAMPAKEATLLSKIHEISKRDAQA